MDGANPEKPGICTSTLLYTKPPTYRKSQFRHRLAWFRSNDVRYTVVSRRIFSSSSSLVHARLRLAPRGNHNTGLSHTLTVSPPRSEASTYLAQVSVS